MLKLDEEHVTQATVSQLSLFRRAATILRSISINFRQSKDCHWDLSMLIMKMHHWSWKLSSSGYWPEQKFLIQTVMIKSNV